MKSFILSFIFSFLLLTANAQTYSIPIDELITKVNIDTLKKYVNDLSGENTVSINGVDTTIVHRVDSRGNDLAADYIIQTLNKTGLSIDDNSYSINGRNIIATQAGTDKPNLYYIICAHYDAVPNYGADDNASGVAAVLETARILSQYEFSHSIIYALWDQEEIGLIGSRDWANNARDGNVNIKGVINLDMIAYNTTQDNKFEIHTLNVANSVELANYVYNFCSIYNLSLSPRIYNPGSGSSDHKAFLENNYGALMLIEPLYQGSFNPYYHTNNDRISLFNMNFFHEMSKLGLGSIASLATGNQITAIDNLISQKLFNLKIFPNPIKNEGYIKLSMAEASSIKIDILSISGITLKTIADNFLTAGDYEFRIANSELTAGFYLLRLQTDFGNQYHKLIILK